MAEEKKSSSPLTLKHVEADIQLDFQLEKDLESVRAELGRNKDHEEEGTDKDNEKRGRKTTYMKGMLAESDVRVKNSNNNEFNSNKRLDEIRHISAKTKLFVKKEKVHSFKQLGSSDKQTQPGKSKDTELGWKAWIINDVNPVRLLANRSPKSMLQSTSGREETQRTIMARLLEEKTMLERELNKIDQSEKENNQLDPKKNCKRKGIFEKEIRVEVTHNVTLDTAQNAKDQSKRLNSKRVRANIEIDESIAQSNNDQITENEASHRAQVDKPPTNSENYIVVDESATFMEHDDIAMLEELTSDDTAVSDESGQIPTRDVEIRENDIDQEVRLATGIKIAGWLQYQQWENKVHQQQNIQTSQLSDEQIQNCLPSSSPLNLDKPDENQTEAAQLNDKDRDDHNQSELANIEFNNTPDPVDEFPPDVMNMRQEQEEWEHIEGNKSQDTVKYSEFNNHEKIKALQKRIVFLEQSLEEKDARLEPLQKELDRLKNDKVSDERPNSFHLMLKGKVTSLENSVKQKDSKIQNQRITLARLNDSKNSLQKRVETMVAKCDKCREEDLKYRENLKYEANDVVKVIYEAKDSTLNKESLIERLNILETTLKSKDSKIRNQQNTLAQLNRIQAKKGEDSSVKSLFLRHSVQSYYQHDRRSPKSNNLGSHKSNDLGSHKSNDLGSQKSNDLGSLKANDLGSHKSNKRISSLSNNGDLLQSPNPNDGRLPLTNDRRSTDLKRQRSADRKREHSSDLTKKRSSDRMRGRSTDRKRKSSSDRKMKSSSDRKRKRSSDRKRERSTDQKRESLSVRKRERSTDQKRKFLSYRKIKRSTERKRVRSSDRKM